MNEQKNRNRFVIGGLLVAIIFMTIGYSALSSQLTISGTAGTGGASWSVGFLSIEKDLANTSTSGVTESINFVVGETTADFDVTLDYPGTEVTYIVTIKNSGTIDATFDIITGVDEVNAIAPTALVYTVTKTDPSDDLLSNGTNTFTVNVEWPASETTVDTTNISKTATINFDYIQKTQ